ncbi:hypothetical protein BaRGS_00024316 [Batillaria attramentaria]|uniref:Polysaccharide pyruvyl transferase domain-containing protein n=1 Tax=Batillaria attramentaria TaxID=370345 RepID=A0ABD0KBU4_9CAEN
MHKSHSATRERTLLNLLLFVTLITLGVVEITIKWDRLVPRPLSSNTEDSEPTTTRKTSPKTILSLSTTNAPEMALFSKIVHVQPLGPKNATRDYAKDLRHGFVTWRDGKALVDTSIVYQPERKPISDVQAFLKKEAVEMSQETDGLSPYLKTSGDVIAEARRVQQSLFSYLADDEKYAVLIGTVASKNKGDSAITIGEMMLLEKLQIELLYYINVFFCNDKMFERAKGLLALHATDEVVILMHGGGNLVGNTYYAAGDCREKAFEAFPNHKKILLSQSFIMSGSKKTVDQRVEMYCCNPKLTILLRDRLSLYIAKRMFTNGTKLLLAPDMAYAIGPISRFSPPLYDIMWLHRSDTESPMYNSLPAFPPNISVRKSDWLKWASPTGTSTVESAHNELMNGLLFLQRGRVVVTDRLHGHILCVLLDIPHVLLDNADNKLSSYYNTWTRGLANTRLTDNPQDAARLAMELLETYSESLPPISKTFKFKE